IDPSYILWTRRSISNGSSPTTHSARPRQILCDKGASMIAFATSADESTSPTPTRPASVWTLTTSVSWLPSPRSVTSGRRRGRVSGGVIFMFSRGFGVCWFASGLAEDRPQRPGRRLAQPGVLAALEAFQQGDGLRRGGAHLPQLRDNLPERQGPRFLAQQ